MTHRLTVDQVAQVAYNAGFRGRALVMAVAISGAETGGTFDAALDSPPNRTSGPDNGSIDRGLWQINNYWHAEVTDAQAHNPDASARAAYRISSGGTSWKQWSTYTSGAYKPFTGEAEAASARVSPGGTVEGGVGQGPPASFLGPDTAPALDVRIGGQQATEALGYYLIGGSVSMTTQEASQLDLLFDDNDYAILERFKLTAGPDGTPIEALNIRWRIFSVGTEPGPKGPATRLTCQPAGVMRLRGFTPHAEKNTSFTDYMARQAGTAGLRFRGEQGAKRADVGPQKIADPVTGEQRDEFAWEVGQRLAQELGFVAYESGGVYHFGSPQFLAETAKSYQLSVRGFTLQPAGTFGEVIKPWGWPTLRTTQLQHGKAPSRTLDVQIPRETIEKMRGGDEILVVGVPLLDNIPSMTVTAVNWDLADAISPGRLQAVDRSRFVTKYVSAADRNASQPIVSDDAGHVAGGASAGTKSALDFVTFCLQQIGDRYIYGAEVNLNDPNPNVWDCSELVQWATHQVGVNFPDGSGAQYAACAAAGKLIPITQAAYTRGALLFEGFHGADHVAVSLGDGQHTIEARGHAYGVNKQPIAGRPWSAAGLIPGMRYS